MTNLSNIQLGYYQVGDLKFKYKAEAVVVSSKSKLPLKWIFHPQVWQNFSASKPKLGVTPLNTLYKLRAQQLRDKYDYLILYYSGGADSHNILRTFIDNNIKLDEICVLRSKIEHKIYTPNTQNVGNENIFSEWDFCIKPTLDWVSVNHPNIKITLSDIFDNKIDNVLNDDTFVTAGQHVDAFGVFRRKGYSENLTKELDKGNRVANIFGIDKPQIVKVGNDCFVKFNDGVNVTLDLREDIEVDIEPFYWTPDMPELVFEQAYRMYKYFSEHPDKQQTIDVQYLKTASVPVYRTTWMNDLQKDLLYTTWDNRFQAEKAFMSGSDVYSRDIYYLQIPELKDLVQRWKFYFSEYSNVTEKEHWMWPVKQRVSFSPHYFLATF